MEVQVGKRRPKLSESPAVTESVPAERNTAGKPQVYALADIQEELFLKLHHANLRWMNTVQKRANLASEFTTKLASARSVPETVSACQEWVRQRMEMAEEDAKQLWADSQAFMGTAARLVSNWASNKTKT
jgi:hypothetical protein